MTFLSRSDALTRKSLEQESISTELLYISRMLMIILLRGKTAGALEIPPCKAGAGGYCGNRLPSYYYGQTCPRVERSRMGGFVT